MSTIMRLLQPYVFAHYKERGKAKPTSRQEFGLLLALFYVSVRVLVLRFTLLITLCTVSSLRN